jgi:hypothetical protein
MSLFLCLLGKMRTKGSYPRLPAANEWVRIKEVADLDAPFNRGLFAEKFIPEGTVFAPYKGKRISDEEAETSRSLYLTRDEDGNTWDGDPTRGGGLAVYANDNRNRFKHNAQLITENGKVHLQVKVGSNGIRPGEEILIAYGPEYWAARHNEEKEEAKIYEMSEQDRIIEFLGGGDPLLPRARYKVPRELRAEFEAQQVAPKAVAAKIQAKPVKAAPRKRAVRMCWDDEVGARIPCWKLQEKKRIARSFGGDRAAYLRDKAQQKRLARERRRAARQ